MKGQGLGAVLSSTMRSVRGCKGQKGRHKRLLIGAHCSWHMKEEVNPQNNMKLIVQQYSVILNTEAITT